MPFSVRASPPAHPELREASSLYRLMPPVHNFDLKLLLSWPAGERATQVTQTRCREGNIGPMFSVARNILHQLGGLHPGPRGSAAEV
jgi:hypothetical protein